MTEYKSGSGRGGEDLDYRLAKQEYKLASRSVLSGNKRIKANAQQIERAYTERLAEEVAKGSRHPERRATIAAEIEALKLCLSTWVALIDLGFKAGQ